jgi:hypothetical protein
VEGRHDARHGGRADRLRGYDDSPKRGAKVEGLHDDGRPEGLHTYGTTQLHTAAAARPTTASLEGGRRADLRVRRKL